MGLKLTTGIHQPKLVMRPASSGQTAHGVAPQTPITNGKTNFKISYVLSQVQPQRWRFVLLCGCLNRKARGADNTARGGFRPRMQ